MEFRILKTLFLSALFNAALLAGVEAQETGPAPVAGSATLGLSVTETDLVAKGWRASKLLREDVYNDKKEKVGRIDDFIVAPDGTLSVAVVDVGGFLGMGAHRVAIPMRQFSDIAPRVILPGATKDALKDLPEFTYAR